MSKTKGQLASNEMREYVEGLFYVNNTSMPLSPIRQMHSSTPSTQQITSLGKALLLNIPTMQQFNPTSHGLSRSLEVLMDGSVDSNAVADMRKFLKDIKLRLSSEHKMQELEAAQMVDHILHAVTQVSNYAICNAVARACVCAMRAGADAGHVRSIAALLFAL